MGKLSVLAVASGCLITLGACSVGGNSAGGFSSGAGAVNWWTWDPTQAASYQNCVAPFEKANPGITVKISQYAWDDYWTKITAGMVSGTAPDAFQDHTAYYPQFVSQSQLLPLNALIERDNFNVGKFSIGIKEWVYRDGKTYGLSMDWGTVGFYYNKDMVAKAGLTAKDMNTMTWNPDNGGTFEKVVARLTVDKKGVRGDEPGFDKNNVVTFGINSLGSNGINGQQSWANFASTTGWTLGNKPNWPTSFDYSKPPLTKTLHNLRGLAEKGFSPKENQSTLGQSTQLGSGSEAMVEDGSWLAPTYFALKGVNVGIAPSVIGPSGGRSALSNSNANSIWKGSPRAEHAWKWISFMGSTNCQSIAGADGTFFPSIAESMKVTEAASLNKGIDLTPFTDQLRAGTLFESPTFNGGQEIGNAITPLMQAYFTFARNEDVFAEMDKLSAQILSKYK